MDGAVGRQRHRLARPAAIGLAAKREQLARHIVQRLDPQHIVAGRDLLDRLALRRRHDQRRRRLSARQHLLNVIGHDRSGLQFPLRLDQCGDRLARHHRVEAGGLRDRQLDPASVGRAHRHARGIEADVAADRDAADVAVHHRERADADILFGGFGDLHRRAPRRAALPFLDDPRIAGAGLRPLAFRHGHQQRVAIGEDGAVLAFGHDKAAFDELARCHDRIRAPRRRRFRRGSARPGSAGFRAAGSLRHATPSSCPRPCPARRRRSASATPAFRRDNRPTATPATARACDPRRPNDWRRDRPAPRRASRSGWDR